jgi:class 3 adenylate cyclase
VVPETRFARSGDVYVAFQTVGEGGIDIVYVPGGQHHVELVWENPPHVRFFERLASFGRLILFDKRGTGMSDRVTGIPTLEARMDDIRAVLAAAGSERAILFGSGDSGPLCVLFAATYPERTQALVLFNTTPRFVRSPALPWLPTRAEYEQVAEESGKHWGEVAYQLEQERQVLPSATEEELERGVRIGRHSLSPSAALTYWRMNLDVDVCDVLRSIRVPTLVLYRSDLNVRRDQSAHYLAEHIPGAQLAALPGGDLAPMWGDQDRLFSELDRFLAAAQQGGGADVSADRVLATILFTDIVDATARAAQLGDRSWAELLSKHHETVRTQLSRFRGREIDAAGDGFFATFDGPARAIHCAHTIRDAVAELGLEVRSGLHTGECELVDGKIGGIAVHIGARILAQARPGEVLVSSTVKDLVAGSGIDFQDRGPHSLKGVPDEWHLYSVAADPL